MRAARIARPVALRGASVSAQTSDAIGESVTNPIDFEEVPGANLRKVIDAP